MSLHKRLLVKLITRCLASFEVLPSDVMVHYLMLLFLAVWKSSCVCCKRSRQHINRKMLIMTWSTLDVQSPSQSFESLYYPHLYSILSPTVPLRPRSLYSDRRGLELQLHNIEFMSLESALNYVPYKIQIYFTQIPECSVLHSYNI